MARDVSAAELMRAVVEVYGRPFRWGVADCCTAACDVFLRLHGVDPMRSLRGLYTSEWSAMALVARRAGRGGLACLARQMATEAELASVAPEVAHPGALGLAPGVAVAGEMRGALATCIGGGFWAVKTEHGACVVSAIEEAWQWPR